MSRRAPAQKLPVEKPSLNKRTHRLWDKAAGHVILQQYPLPYVLFVRFFLLSALWINTSLIHTIRYSMANKRGLTPNEITESITKVNSIINTPAASGKVLDPWQ